MSIRHSLAILILLASSPGFAREIQHDAEQRLLQDQHEEAWKAEDAEISRKLEEIRTRTGKRPNIIHIMWDDQSLGEVGIPELNKVLGYDTPHINRMADEGIAFTRFYTEPSCTPLERRRSRVDWRFAPA